MEKATLAGWGLGWPWVAETASNNSKGGGLAVGLREKRGRRVCVCVCLLGCDYFA